jgi:hypothetical protein
MDEKMNEQLFEACLAELPEQIAVLARAEFPGFADCYRIINDPGHYCLVGFGQPDSFPEFPATPQDEAIMAVLMHGKDSTSPGDILIKVRFTELVICNCATWELADGITIDDYEIEIPKGTWN